MKYLITLIIGLSLGVIITKFFWSVPTLKSSQEISEEDQKLIDEIIKEKQELEKELYNLVNIDQNTGQQLDAQELAIVKTRIEYHRQYDKFVDELFTGLNRQADTVSRSKSFYFGTNTIQDMLNQIMVINKNKKDTIQGVGIYLYNKKATVDGKISYVDCALIPVNKNGDMLPEEWSLSDPKLIMSSPSYNFSKPCPDQCPDK
ncbi:MAG: hypothetical protein CMP48_08130 [Rickettsiales bacterium]|nr:hypothetical protein [Rickettsiales bacterium]